MKGVIRMANLTCSELSSEQIKSLLILEDEVVEKILKGRLRGVDDNVSETEIISTWNKIVEKAKNILQVELATPQDANGIKNEIFCLAAKKLT